MGKLLFISTVNSSFHKPMLNAFNGLGFEVATMDFRGSPIFKINHPVHKAIGKLPLVVAGKIKAWAHKKFAVDILSMAHDFRPDFIFFVRFPEMDLEILDQLRKSSIVINYYPETMDQWGLIKKIAPHYDYFLNYDPYVVELMNKEGIGNPLYVPFSADIDQGAQWTAPKKFKYNITFIGTYYKKLYAEREDIFNAVKDLGLNIWGNKGWLDTSLRDYYRGHPSIEDMGEIYRNSCIGINADISTEVAGTGVNLRPFEVTAAGALLLNRDDRADIFNLFEDGKEFISFHGVGDVRQRAEYYLNHLDERNAIAKAGFERVKNDHNYVKEFRKIFNLISSKHK